MTAGRYVVFGHPIDHSLSPVIHRAFGQQFALDVDYRTLDATPSDFAAAVHVFFDHGGRGANVTLPHKAAAMALADEVSEVARRAGSANVLTRLADGRLAAHSTDGAGMVRDMLHRQQIALDDRRVLLLGAGGAARGVAWALLDAGVRSLTVANRSPARALAMVRTITDAMANPRRVIIQKWSALAELGAFELIVNATSAGVLGEEMTLPGTVATAKTQTYDLSYGAAAESFLTWARGAGAQAAVDGLGMLVETAADTFELWHGRRPQTDPVYQQLRS